MRTLPQFREEEGRTVVPLEFAPNQSWFIVFQKPVGRPVMSRGQEFPAHARGVRVDGSVGGGF